MSNLIRPPPPPAFPSGCAPLPSPARLGLRLRPCPSPSQRRAPAGRESRESRFDVERAHPRAGAKHGEERRPGAAAAERRSSARGRGRHGPPWRGAAPGKRPPRAGARPGTRSEEEEMERPAPVRSSHTSTADLLAWPQPQGTAPATPSPPRHPGQPSEAIRKVVFGGQVTEEEADSLTKRKPCSAPKWKEMTGSGIFMAGSNGDSAEAAAAAKPARTASRQDQLLQLLKQC